MLKDWFDYTCIDYIGAHLNIGQCQMYSILICFMYSNNLCTCTFNPEKCQACNLHMKVGMGILNPPPPPSPADNLCEQFGSKSGSTK